MKPVPRRRRRKVFERDGYKCRRCGAGGELTIDHITPRSKGGTNAMGNLQTLCVDCNRTKDDTNGIREWAARRAVARRRW